MAVSHYFWQLTDIIQDPRNSEPKIVCPFYKAWKITRNFVDKYIQYYVEYNVVAGVCSYDTQRGRFKKAVMIYCVLRSES